MAEYLSKKTGKLAAPGGGVFSVGDLVSLLKPEHEAERRAYFKFRLASLIEESSSGSEDVDPEIREVTAMGLGEFESFIEILMAYRGKYHRQYITECLDSLLLKNKENGLLGQSRTKGSPRRFVLGSKLLEVLLQVAVLTQDGGCFVTREVRIEELLAFLEKPLWLFTSTGYPKEPRPNSSRRSSTDAPSAPSTSKPLSVACAKSDSNEDLSDAYVTQKVSPPLCGLGEMTEQLRTGGGHAGWSNSFNKLPQDKFERSGRRPAVPSRIEASLGSTWPQATACGSPISTTT